MRELITKPGGTDSNDNSMLHVHNSIRSNFDYEHALINLLTCITKEAPIIFTISRLAEHTQRWQLRNNLSAVREEIMVKMSSFICCERPAVHTGSGVSEHVPHSN